MIDAHVHVWQIGAHGCVWPDAKLPALHRNFDLADFRSTAGTTDVSGVILVQSQEDMADTHWLLTEVAQDPLVAGVIGWCDLLASDAVGRVADLSRWPKLRGLRPMVQDLDFDWYDDPALDAGLAAMADAGLVLEALVRPRHLSALVRLARRHPALRIVVDHAAKPDIHALARWAGSMRALATCPQTWCKLSGLVTEVPAGHSGCVAEMVAVLVDTFGPERLLWGSDWPVVTLGAPYGDWLTQARSLVPAGDHDAVFRDTAARVYGVTP